MDSNTTHFPKLYHLEFESRPEYLYALLTAEEDSLELSISYWKEVSQNCKKIKCEKLLVEEDIPKNAISMFEMYEFVNQVIMELLNINIAFVDSYIDQMEANKFAELVATNRGVSVKVFNNFDEAERWLLSL